MIYVLSRYISTVLGFSTGRQGMSEILQEERSRHESDYMSNITYYQRSYGSVENYVGQMMQHYTVHSMDSDKVNITKGLFVYSPLSRTSVINPELSSIDVTSTFLQVEDTTREGNLKVFATVVKTGLKSTGMEVILDPHLVGSRVHPVSYYENLVGTFSRIKATTLVSEDYGYATLFFSPEALGNIRIETQQLSAKIVTLL